MGRSRAETTRHRSRRSRRVLARIRDPRRSRRFLARSRDRRRCLRQGLAQSQRRVLAHPQDRRQSQSRDRRQSQDRRESRDRRQSRDQPAEPGGWRRKASRVVSSVHGSRPTNACSTVAQTVSAGPVVTAWQSASRPSSRTRPGRSTKPSV